MGKSRLFLARGRRSRVRGTAVRVVVSIGLAAFALAACEPESERLGNVTTRPGGPDAVEVVAENTAFTPDSLRLEADQQVTVEITNEDDSVHDFAIEGLGLNTGPIEPGDVATATFVVPDSPTEFVCTFHSGMTGDIVAY
jgi:plastocyanin